MCISRGAQATVYVKAISGQGLTDSAKSYRAMARSRAHVRDRVRSGLALPDTARYLQGALALLVGYGAGICFAAQVIRLP
jgi:hypothetical protein